MQLPNFICTSELNMNNPENSSTKTKQETLKKGTDEYLDVLEDIKEQYQQYMDISGIYDLLNMLNKQKEEKFLPPTPENPLTTNRTFCQRRLRRTVYNDYHCI